MSEAQNTGLNLVDLAKIRPEIGAYSPWLLSPAQAWEAGFSQLPAFRRDAFDAIHRDVTTLPQMVSVTGPRRVGKTTLLKQCMQKIIADAPDPAAQAQRVAYMSMDDPALDLPGADKDQFFDALVAAATQSATQATSDAQSAGPTYLFLDEIQRFPRWELYLKKFYDLKAPVKFVVSGSASSPIFKKSRESLLGRIKEYRVLPFNFREWAKLRQTSSFEFNYLGPDSRPVDGPIDALVNEFRRVGTDMQYRPPPDLTANIKRLSRHQLPVNALEYFFDGGFPEVWNLSTLEAKQTYLYQNQVERVIFEDLLIATEFRKPDMLRRFYLGLLKDPGREVNIAQLAQSLELDRRTIESYFPLLEATDLVWRLHKHTSTRSTPKAGNFKTYLVDLAVRNAVMKLTPERMAADATLMGHYAENVVANHLRRWPGLVELGYWRKNNDEVDFIVDLGSSQIAVEVKYRNDVQNKEAHKAARLAEQLQCQACVVVSKDPWPQEQLDALAKTTPVPTAVVPLAAFLMLF